MNKIMFNVLSANKIRLICLVLSLLLFVSCNQPGSSKEIKEGTIVPKIFLNKKIELKTYSNNSTLSGFGYDIFINDSLYVHQPHIPAIQGEKGFASKLDAEKIGNLVIIKIRNGVIPPSITISDLDSLEIHQ